MFIIPIISPLQGDGTGLTSIYAGQPFADENFKKQHDTPGILSMVKSYFAMSIVCYLWCYIIFYSDQ